MRLILLDDPHLADTLFVQTLGRFVAGHAGPLVFVHGDGGLTARALEARGHLPGDPLPHGLDASALDAARAAATRAQGQALARRLSDAGVPAVALQGSDRGLLTAGADGTVEAPRARWLADEAGRGVVPLVGLTARGPDATPAPVDAAAALAALVRAMAEAPSGGLSADAVEVALLAPLDRPTEPADARTAAALEALGVPVRVAPLPALFAPAEVARTRPAQG